MDESFGGRVRRRAVHLGSHPFAWIRYLWVREVRQQEVPFAVNPRFADWQPGFRVARAGLQRLTGVSPTTLDGYFAELRPLHERLLREVGSLPSAGALMQAPSLYVLVRALRPQRLVETGISSGYSARLLLEALRANGQGHLDSIGIDVFALREPDRAAASGLGTRRVGWLVPPEFADQWTLHLGRSEEVLPGLLAKAGSIDLFLHDSLHQYPTMRWEYATAFPHLRPGGLLLSHDIHANRAWADFVTEHGRPEWEELDHDLGALRRATA